MQLTTLRLKLRLTTRKDIPDIVANINNLNVSRWLAVVPYPYRKKHAEGWLESQKKHTKEKPRKDYTFGIELKSERKIIEGIDIHHIDKYAGKATIGYWLGEDYWRQGYGSEALGAVLNFAFKRLKLRRLEAEVYVGNPSSKKLLEKFGFRREGMKRKAVKCKADGKIHDAYIYGLLKEEYRKR